MDAGKRGGGDDDGGASATTNLRARRVRRAGIESERGAKKSKNPRRGTRNNPRTATAASATVDYDPSSRDGGAPPRSSCSRGGGSTPDGLYGDMAAMCTGFVIIPDLGWKLYRVLAAPTDDPDCPPPRHRMLAPYVYLWWVLTCAVHFYAQYLRWYDDGNNKKRHVDDEGSDDDGSDDGGDRDRCPSNHQLRVFLSRLACFGCTVGSAFMDVADWPYMGESTITKTYQHGVVIGVLANVSLSFREKMVRLGTMFVLGSLVSVQSPYSVYAEDALPVLGGTILLAVFGLYCVEVGATRGIATVLLARFVLAAIYVHHTVGVLATINLMEGFSARDNLEAMVRASVVACIGIVATGTFQEEIMHKERLEDVVRNRTQKLYMVNMALQASETAIAITDRWGSIVWLNAAFERLSGGEEEELLDLLLKNVIFDLDRTRKENKYLLMELYEDLSKSNEEELQVGESIFRVEATPFSSRTHSRDKAASNDRFLMVFKDITAGRAREVAEKKAHHEATMAKAMGESMMTLTHELRTPLQGIMGVTSLMLQQADLKNDALESLKLIMASSTLLLNLVNNLLDVRKATAQMMEDFPLASIAASGPIKDAVGFCQPLASISNVRIVTELGTAQNAIVHSHALRLQQIMINVISNAIKYTRRESEIRIQIRTILLGDVKRMINGAIASTQSHDGRNHNDESFVLVFSVSDCGPGIPAEQAGRLFHRFAQLDRRPSRTLGGNAGQPSGTGLGLHLCQLFVERMNGQIWATNNGNDSGACFSFYLPLVSGSAYGILENPGMTNISMVPYCRSSSREDQDRLNVKKYAESMLDRRVLLVDNDAILRKVYHRMLKKIGINNLVTVESGEKALRELSRNCYNLVITDLQMPGMSGTELSAEIRSSGNEAARPIVVGLTADTSANVVERCSQSGMSDVLYKPITLSEMKNYFETTLPNLKPGIWYDANSAYDMDYLGMNVISMQISKQSAAKKNERLLLEVFPENIAEALREGKRIEPQHHDIVTIYFSDIVGFTNISSILTPIKVSSMLDRLYLKFDQLSMKHDVFKIETIGDAYMAVTNLVKKQDDHVKRIANFSKDTIDAAVATLIDEDNPELGHVKIRVGFHTGPVVSNVVGSRNPKFAIFGDTVNISSRMESNSRALQIQCSESSALILKDEHPDIPCTLRGRIEVKGKGEMTTYWVHFKQQQEHRGISSPDSSMTGITEPPRHSEGPRRGLPSPEIPGLLSSQLSLLSSVPQSLFQGVLADAPIREDGHAGAQAAHPAAGDHVCDQPDAAAGGLTGR